MDTVELTKPVRFFEVCRLWQGDVESLIHALIERGVDCYIPASPGSVDPGTGSGQYKVLEKITEGDFETIRFDYDDINLLMLFERVRNNEKVTVADVRFGPKVPSVDAWCKSITTAVKIINHYLQSGNKLPPTKNRDDEWKDLIDSWNKDVGDEKAYRLHDKAKEELWRAIKVEDVKAVKNPTYSKKSTPS